MGRQADVRGGLEKVELPSRHAAHFLGFVTDMRQLMRAPAPRPAHPQPASHAVRGTAPRPRERESSRGSGAPASAVAQARRT